MTEDGSFVAVQSFTFYIDDDRSAFLIRRPVRIPDSVGVRERAQAVLDESEHYRGIEVVTAARSLFRISARAFALGESE